MEDIVEGDTAARIVEVAHTGAAHNGVVGSAVAGTLDIVFVAVGTGVVGAGSAEVAAVVALGLVGVGASVEGTGRSRRSGLGGLAKPSSREDSRFDPKSWVVPRL
mmetsp:Transcript_34666/g.77752  ORF Transcript_34666/g.77752 Transcript_34666/m.77752 type:complete len:105 (-) Transcript_34666:134-448(-)